jgi:hypothetical protein
VNRFARRDNFGHPLRNPLLREHFVYRAFDAAGDLLYVGCTARLEQRAKQHRGQSAWWPHAVRFTITGPYNFETARDLERVAIESERSLYNDTPERVALKSIHSRVFERHYRYHYYRLGAAMGEPGLADRIARERAEYVSGHAWGRGPCRIDDLTIPAALRREAEDLREFETTVAAAPLWLRKTAAPDG